MNYNQLIQRLQVLMVVPLNNTDSDFDVILPEMLESGELRIYRELDFLTTITRTTAALTAASRNVTLPSNIVVLESMSVITPVTATSGDAGTRNNLRRVSLDYMDAMWPNVSNVTGGVPRFYSMTGNMTGAATGSGGFTVSVAPTPSTAYTAEFVGTLRPAPIGPTNTQTVLSVYEPDLLIASCMTFGMKYQRDAEMAASWEQTYSTIRDGLNIEALRQKAKSADWGSRQPSAMANQPLDRAS